jgi:hypothetical protein
LAYEQDIHHHETDHVLPAPRQPAPGDAPHDPPPRGLSRSELRRIVIELLG